MLLRGMDLENSGQRGRTVGKQEAAGGGREVAVGMSLGADGGVLVAVMCSLRIYTRPPSANQSRLFAIAKPDTTEVFPWYIPPW